MKLPPAIDAVMWELAESSDQAALDAFAERYPEHKAELAQRMRMVRGLRGFKPSSMSKDKFVPVNEPLSMPTTNRWAVPLAAVLVIGSVVFASVSVTRWLDKQSHSPTVERTNPPLVAPKREENVKLGPGGNPAIKDANGDGIVKTEKPKAPPTPWDTLVTIKSDKLSLADALRAIGAQAGVSLELAPGMPDVDIAADYEGQPAQLVMQDMGRNFGFSVLVQTQNTALVVPAVDPHAPPPERVAGTSALARELGKDERIP